MPCEDSAGTTLTMAIRQVAPRRNDTAAAAVEEEEDGGVAMDLFVVENKTKRNLSVQVGYISLYHLIA